MTERNGIGVILGTASSGGTIAAVRNLASNGIEVAVLASSGPRFSAASWSRFATTTYATPPESDTKRYLDRLMEIGKARPGQLLLPTSDETAWLFTENAELLATHFRVYQPSIQAMRRILDKSLFGQAAIRAGVSILPVWEPKDLAELRALSQDLPYPILIKPRTHVHRLRNDKGSVANSSDELLNEYASFVEREKVRGLATDLLPDAAMPILQQFVNVTNDGVCSVSGFIDRSGELYVTRRTTKVLQRSYPVGVGVCFESLPHDEALAQQVRSLCRELNYFGMFEVEFIKFGGEWCVIDFNPRLFNQAGMDIRRGMPLPYLAYLDAVDDRERLRQATELAQVESHGNDIVFSDAFTLRATLTARRLTGRITPQELAHWHNWMKAHTRHNVDVVRDRNDPRPAFIHMMSELALGIRAFRRFLKLTPRTHAEPAYSSETHS